MMMIVTAIFLNFLNVFSHPPLLLPFLLLLHYSIGLNGIKIADIHIEVLHEFVGECAVCYFIFLVGVLSRGSLIGWRWVGEERLRRREGEMTATIGVEFLWWRFGVAW
jgi:hypothetical protein